MSRSPAAVFLWAATLALAPGAASAQEGLVERLTAVLETNVSSTTTKTTDTVSGTVTKRTFDNVFPRLTVNAETMLYPSLRLSTGGVFEVNALFSPDKGGDTTITKLRPFFELRSTSPILAPGFGYYRREERSRVAGVSTLGFVSEDYTGFLAWKPDGLPQTNFQFVRTNTFDIGRNFLDTTKDFGSIISRYAYKSLNAYYLGSSLDTTDRLQGVDTHQVSNGGRVDYSQSFFDKRLLWNTTYNVAHLSLSTESTGASGEVAVPVIPSGGVSSLSDTPVTARLSPNPLLVDSNLTAAAGINLGLPPVGADAQARNIGLDFLNPTEINRLLVWIDRELPREIVDTFSWDVYSSPDNLLWTREATVPTARFGPFENRFQIDFQSITARYLKVVVRPLSGAIPEASRYPDIFVTEVQAFLTRPAGEVPGTIASTSQNFTTDVRYRMMDSVFYEGSYWFNDAGASSPARQLLSNGVSVNHRFGRMWGAYARGALEQGTEPAGHRVAGVSNATLTFEPIRTFTASLLYTGRNERIDGRPNDRRGVSVQTNSQLYRGIDLQFGLGWNRTTRENGESLRDRFLNLAATVIPRSSMTLTVSYSGSSTDRSGLPGSQQEYRTKRVLATLSYDPIRTLHVVVSEQVEAGETDQRRIFTNVGVNWSPFPDGSLQFFVAYNEALRPLEFGTERNFRPGVRWWFSRRSYLDLSYRKLRTEFVVQTEETEIVSANVRLFL